MKTFITIASIAFAITSLVYNNYNQVDVQDLSSKLSSVREYYKKETSKANQALIKKINNPHEKFVFSVKRITSEYPYWVCADIIENSYQSYGCSYILGEYDDKAVAEFQLDKFLKTIN